MEKKIDTDVTATVAEPLHKMMGAVTGSGSTENVEHADTIKQPEGSSAVQPLSLKHRTSMAQAWRDFSGSFTNLFATARYHSVNATPGIILNNSTNLLGASHVLTEMAMLKASSAEIAPDGRKVAKALVKDAKGPLDWTFKAFENLFIGTWKGSMPQDGSIKEIIRDPKPLSKLYHHLFDVEAATEREVLRQTTKANAAGKPIGRDQVKMGNSWQTRSTLFGLAVWSLSTVIPDKKEDPKEVERMVTLQQTSPLGYIGERLKQAVWFPDWGGHKRQMIGLGIMGSGVMSTLGAWRRRGTVEEAGLKVLKYRFDRSYLITSAFTFLSSLPLLFASDDQKGFAGFGTLMMGRLFSLPSSIHGQFKNKEPGALWYTGATASFQAENLAQALIGGAEKRSDGTIIDYSEIEKTAKQKAKDNKRHSGVNRAHEAEKPTSKVSQVSETTKAMPERTSPEQQLDAGGAPAIV